MNPDRLSRCRVLLALRREGGLCLLKVALVCAGLVLLNAGGTGCSWMGYNVGSTLPPGIRSVFVPVFANQTGEPQLEFETTNAAIQEFQKDGTLRVAGKDQADAILEVKITRYDLAPVRYREDQRTTAREYRLTLTADMSFRKLANSEVLMTKTVTGEATFAVIGDLPTAQRNALPAAAKNLAHYLVRNVVEYW